MKQSLSMALALVGANSMEKLCQLLQNPSPLLSSDMQEKLKLLLEKQLSSWLEQTLNSKN
jgi:hypothetical protein